MRYYYGQLSRPLQGVYDALLGGFRALAPGIRIPMLDEKQLADVYLRLKLDEPLLFYVTGYRCRWMTGAAHMELLPEYLFDKAKIRTHQQAVSARRKKSLPCTISFWKTCATTSSKSRILMKFSAP